MNHGSGKRRPLSVTLVALLLIVAGAVGLVYHAREIDFRQPFHDDTVSVELVRVVAIVAGVFLLMGRNWARWLAVAWIGFHVVISVFHSWQQVAMHAVVFAVFAYVLFRPAASRYFRNKTAG